MHAHGQGVTASINVGDYVLVRHGSADFAKNRRKHGHPALRRFRVVREAPAAGAVRIDPAGTGTRPYVSCARGCERRHPRIGGLLTMVHQPLGGLTSDRDRL
eukprot:5354543-Pleurochrysis_carterae.AAC.1